jgi:hypothetical protein
MPDQLHGKIIQYKFVRYLFRWPCDAGQLERSRKWMPREGESMLD